MGTHLAEELPQIYARESATVVVFVSADYAAPHPVVIIGTLWPDRYTVYTTVPAPGDAARAGARSVGPSRRRPRPPRVQPGRAGPGPRRRYDGEGAGPGPKTGW